MKPSFTKTPCRKYNAGIFVNCPVCGNPKETTVNYSAYFQPNKHFDEHLKVDLRR